MRVNEMKDELEKVSKVLPELRRELDEVYQMDSGRKSRLKILWREYETKVREMKSSKEYRDLIQ